MSKKVFTTSQVARLLGVSNRTVAVMFDNRVFGGFRIPKKTGSEEGGDRRFTRESVVQYMRRNNIPLGNLGECGVFRVLLVAYREAKKLKDMLPADLYTVHTVDSVFDAGRQVEVYDPDAVVVDWDMGRSDALAVLEGIKRRQVRTFVVALMNEDENKVEEVVEKYSVDRTFRRPSFGVIDVAERLRWVAMSGEYDRKEVNGHAG